MLQIRLSKAGVPAGDSGGSTISAAAKPSHVAETVTVACPDHLIIADLPVAKALGAASSPAGTSVLVRSVGRRCRRLLGERVHFCVGCDFPIAVYGRLIPCEHVFCLTCARSDSSCYLCEERIQKIQTIKMMEGIYICAAPHCLKSFLKRSDFESHIQEMHVDLLQANADEGTNEMDNVNTTKPASTDTHAKQMTQPESSTARAPPRPGVSPTANSQPQDRDDRSSRQNQSREQTPMRPPPQLTPHSFHGRQQQQSSDSQPDNNSHLHQGVWYQHPQPPSFDSQSGSLHRRDSDQAMSEKPVAQESPFRDYPPHPFTLPNYQVPMMFNPGINVPPFGVAPIPLERPQQIFHAPMEMPRPEMSGPDQGSVLGFPPLPVGMAGFPDNYPQWNNAVFANPQFIPQPVGIINPQGYMNPMDSHARPPHMQGEFEHASDGLPLNPHMPKEQSELSGGPMSINDGKGILAPPMPILHHLPISLPPPPPLPQSLMPQQIRGKFPGPD